MSVYKTVGEKPDNGAKQKKIIKTNKSKLDELSTPQEPETEPEIINTMHSNTKRYKKKRGKSIMITNSESRMKERVEKYDKIRSLFNDLEKANTQEKRDSIKRTIREVAAKNGISKVNFPEHLQSPDDFRAAKENLLKKIKSIK